MTDRTGTPLVEMRDIRIAFGGVSSRPRQCSWSADLGARTSRARLSSDAATLETLALTGPRDGAPAPTLSPDRPPGNLAQVMRGILFPSSNLIFNVQNQDPGEQKVGWSPGTTSFAWVDWGAGIYSGWELVDYAAIESGKLRVQIGEMDLRQHRPLQVGETYAVQPTIVDVVRKEGRSGTFDLIATEFVVRGDDGEPAATLRNTYVCPRRA